MFPLPLIAYEYARKAFEAHQNENTEGPQPKAPPPPSLPERILEGLAFTVLPPAPVARWFGKVVQDNVDFARMLADDPAGTLKDFGSFLLDSLKGEERAFNPCIPYLLLGPAVFPPVFAFGAASFLATPETFRNVCRSPEADLEDLGKTALKLLMLGAMPGVAFTGAKLLGRSAQAVRPVQPPVEEERSFVREAAEILVGPLSTVIF